MSTSINHQYRTLFFYPLSSTYTNDPIKLTRQHKIKILFVVLTFTITFRALCRPFYPKLLGTVRTLIHTPTAESTRQCDSHLARSRQGEVPCQTRKTSGYKSTRSIS